MKFIAILLLCLTAGPLLAQPVVTLSANTFYLGDAPGSYTVTCPIGTSARVSSLVKISDVPASLANPSVAQLANGTVFWPETGNTGIRVYTCTLPQATAGAGILEGSAGCYAPLAGTPPTTFTITLAGISQAEAEAQKTWALNANSLKLPQLTTSEQATLPPQQTGNMVYNTDQKQVAVHNGSSWQYLASTAPIANQFQNGQAFTTSGTSTWTVPAGVTRVMAEAWGGGAGGNTYSSNGSLLSAVGGGAGGYGMGFLNVMPGSVLTIKVGSFGTSTNDGFESRIEFSSGGFFASGGSKYGGGGSSAPLLSQGAQPFLVVGGGSGTEITWTYGQQNATTYMWILKCGDGGIAYGAQPGGQGETFQSSNLGVVGFRTNNYNAKQGSFPGGGGGAGYDTGGFGGGGMVVLHW